MKINIKDIFEKDEGTSSVHTNSRLDVEEVFSEALSPESEAEAEPAPGYEEEPAPEAEPEPEPEEESAPEQEPEIEPEPDSEVEIELAHEVQAEPATEAESEPEIEDEVEPEPESEVEPESEEEPALEIELEVEPKFEEETEPEPEPEQEPEVEPEPEEEAKPEPEPEPEPDAQKTRRFALPENFRWPAGIAAAFAAIILVVIVYTTMIPREVNAVINGEEFGFTTREYTVEGFLEDEKIEFCEDDYISVPLTTFIYDGIELEIKHATDFKVTADGKTVKCKSLANTVGEALKDEGIKVGKNDIVTPGTDSLLKRGMKIVIQRVEFKEEVVEETVKFKTVEKDDTSLNEGTSKVVTEGSDGKDKVTYQVTYIDGKETERKEISRETLTKAVDKVIANGTRINYNGKTYSRKLVVKAYAYTGGGRTAMGTRARVGEIAVDPSVIPLGTNVYIEGVGPRRAEDTGGNIKGNTIDIYMDTQSQCLSWGARYVTIYIQ